MTGVFFEVEGGLGGVLALLLPAASCERLLAHLLGGAGHDRSDPASQSALREVGNILASHAANAVGEMLGVTMLPSIPRLALEDATGALARLLARRAPHPPELRVETEICDRARELCGILVFAPDRLQDPARVRAARGLLIASRAWIETGCAGCSRPCKKDAWLRMPRSRRWRRRPTSKPRTAASTCTARCARAYPR